LGVSRSSPAGSGRDRRAGAPARAPLLAGGARHGRSIVITILPSVRGLARDPEPSGAGAAYMTMLLFRAAAVWVVLMGAEVVHGVLRRVYLVPRVGDLRARQIGVFIGSARILMIASLTARWLQARTTASQVLVGSLWLVLTLAFEAGLGRLVLRYSWERVVSDSDLRRGGLLPVGLLVLVLAPWLSSRLAGRRRPNRARRSARSGIHVSGKTAWVRHLN
jgi:hypothetical protein